MSKTVQQAATARHSTTGEMFVMRAGLVTPRLRVNNVEKTRNCDATRKLLPPEANFCRLWQQGEKVNWEIHLTISGPEHSDLQELEQ
jgi:hypothetical protein